MFNIPIVAYSSLNILQAHSHHFIMKFSYYMSWLYLLFICSTVPMIIAVSNRPVEILRDKDFSYKWGILYKQYHLDPSINKFFTAFSIVRYILFSINIVFFYYFPIMQVFVSFVISLAYLVILAIKRPYYHKKDLIKNLIYESLLSFGNILFLILAFDESFNTMDVDFRIKIGWLI